MNGQVFVDGDSPQAGKHDFVFNGSAGWLAIRKESTSTSTWIQNDWGWIPVFRSRAALEEQLPARVDMHSHPTVLYLHTELTALRAAFNEQQQLIDKLLAKVPVDVVVEEPNGNRKLQL
jgi:hypothetical protein